MGIKPSFEAVKAVAALPGVQRKSLTRFEADFSNRCESPVDVRLDAHPSTSRIVVPSMLDASVQAQIPRDVDHLIVPSKEFLSARGMSHPLFVDIQVRCRKCRACLRTRALLWAHKAQEEIREWPRTWFATYTGTPQQHWEWEMRASTQRRDSGHEFIAQDDDAKFFGICSAAGPDLTRYVKRVRKATGAPLRYFIVAERHASGLPHWHALIHEVDSSKPIRKAVLKEQWPHGFSRFKLVENPGAAWYLCKYLSKDIGTRVRASLRYGFIRP